MKDQTNLTLLKVLNTVAFLIMVTVNALANILPINGVTTGEVSDSYKNLFAPAGITFSIWGLIYLLLALFIVYQLGLLKRFSTPQDNVIKEISMPFIISSLANAAWIFAWHYNQIWITLILMLVILVSLGIVFVRLHKADLSGFEKVFIRLAFSVYFGWITIATIANVTTFLVSVGWNGRAISEPVWTVIILIVGILIGMVTAIKYKDIAYGLVILWAYIGILIKHLSKTGFDGEYPIVITIVVICSVIALLCIGYIAFKKVRGLR